MSTQPLPQPPQNELLALLYKQTNSINRAFLWASHFVKTHEKLLAVIIAAALVWGVSGKVQNVIAAHDQKNLSVAQAARDAQSAANVAQAQKNAELATQYQDLTKQAQAQAAQLEKANVALATALAKQQAVDATLPPLSLAARIETLAEIPSGSVLPQAGNQFSVSNDGAVGIAQKLENVPVQQEKLANVQQEKLASDQLLVAANTVIAGLNTQVDGLKAEVKQADNVCADKLKVQHDKDAKSKRKWFEIGYIAGLATRGAIKLLGGV